MRHQVLVWRCVDTGGTAAVILIHFSGFSVQHDKGILLGFHAYFHIILDETLRKISSTRALRNKIHINLFITLFIITRF